MMSTTSTILTLTLIFTCWSTLCLRTTAHHHEHHHKHGHNQKFGTLLTAGVLAKVLQKKGGHHHHPQPIFIPVPVHVQGHHHQHGGHGRSQALMQPFEPRANQMPFGISQQGGPMMGGPMMGGPMMGGPMMGSPMMGGPMMGSPMMGSPMMGGPMMGGMMMPQFQQQGGGYAPPQFQQAMPYMSPQMPQFQQGYAMGGGSYGGQGVSSGAQTIQIGKSSDSSTPVIEIRLKSD